MARPAKDPPQPPAISRISLTVPEFCLSVGISKSTYEKLKREGKHPQEMQIGKSVRISQEAAAAWCREREKDRKPVAAA